MLIKDMQICIDKDVGKKHVIKLRTYDVLRIKR